MVKHDDRDSCEISATACLGYVSEKPWSIWLTDKNNNDIEFILLACDGLWDCMSSS